MFITNLSSLLDRFVSLLTQHQEKSKQIDGDENKVSAEDDNEAEKIAKEEAPKVPPSLQPDEEIHPFAPTDHFVSPPVCLASWTPETTAWSLYPASQGPEQEGADEIPGSAKPVNLDYYFSV